MRDNRQVGLTNERHHRGASRISVRRICSYEGGFVSINKVVLPYRFQAKASFRVRDNCQVGLTNDRHHRGASRISVEGVCSDEGRLVLIIYFLSIR